MCHHDKDEAVTSGRRTDVVRDGSQTGCDMKEMKGDTRREAR